MIEVYKLFTLSSDDFRKELDKIDPKELRNYMFFAHGFIREVEKLRGNVKEE